MTQTSELDEFSLLAVARSGGHEAFQHLVDRYRRELLVHCYRMLGSLEDAEDTLQEALLRAWRRLDSFEQLASLRAWLYKIATNTALDGLDIRHRRLMPDNVRFPGQPGDSSQENSREIVWLEPLPDALVDERPASDPAALYETRESVTLAFLVALQYLPGRQRAVLILRDVLGWHADEVAELLDTTVHAVNSALSRARKTLKQNRQDRTGTRLDDGAQGASDAQMATLLDRYVAAWEASDSAALVALLHEDATLTMPPLPLWYRGRANIEWFLSTQLFTKHSQGRFCLLPTRAKGSPAFAMYQRDEAGVYRPVALHVLTIGGISVAREVLAIDDFLTTGSRMFARFGMPPTI